MHAFVVKIRLGHGDGSLVCTVFGVKCLGLFVVTEPNGDLPGRTREAAVLVLDSVLALAIQDGPSLAVVLGDLRRRGVVGRGHVEK